MGSTPGRGGRSNLHGAHAIGTRGTYDGDVLSSRDLGAAFGQLPHRSLWRRRLVARVGTLPLQEYLIEQANLRGFFGAFSPGEPRSSLDPELDIEEIVVGLSTPHAPLDVRAFKLLVRILQSDQIRPDHLAWLARKERANFALHWLLAQVPAQERTPPLEEVARRFRSPPRGSREARLSYDPARLVRNPASSKRLWRTRHR